MPPVLAGSILCGSIISNAFCCLVKFLTTAFLQSHEVIQATDQTSAEVAFLLSKVNPSLCFWVPVFPPLHAFADPLSLPFHLYSLVNHSIHIQICSGVFPRASHISYPLWKGSAWPSFLHSLHSFCDLSCLPFLLCFLYSAKWEWWDVLLKLSGLNKKNMTLLRRCEFASLVSCYYNESL